MRNHKLDDCCFFLFIWGIEYWHPSPRRRSLRLLWVEGKSTSSWRPLLWSWRRWQDDQVELERWSKKRWKVGQNIVVIGAIRPHNFFDSNILIIKIMIIDIWTSGSRTWSAPGATGGGRGWTCTTRALARMGRTSSLFKHILSPSGKSGRSDSKVPHASLRMSHRRRWWGFIQGAGLTKMLAITLLWQSVTTG